MKAYLVGDPMDDEGRTVIVHAATPSQARSQAANTDEVGNASYTELRAVRAASFDGLDGEALAEAQLEAGWWWECHGCYERVSIETPHRVNRFGTLFCSPQCCIRFEKKERQLREETWEALRRAVHFWPGASIERLYKNTFGDWVVDRYGLGYHIVDCLPEGPVP